MREDQAMKRLSVFAEAESKMAVREVEVSAREEAMDEYIEEDDDREDIIVEIGSLLATPRGARDVV